ncbi:MAG: hypothetical protein IM318_06215 [Microcystis sp. M017S1]|uniref:hypothetical protein n=1 Tax=unclassified Microcystis TaxID=2643300 RepID=UPI00258B6AB4|nr:MULTISPECIES: hypothetical protein [unclassified Microcystis]MCA2917314.1 hypothetical protein [Microcystis sp. M017S1]
MLRVTEPVEVLFYIGGTFHLRGKTYIGFAAKSFSVVAGCGVWGVGCGVLPVLRWPIT